MQTDNVGDNQAPSNEEVSTTSEIPAEVSEMIVAEVEEIEAPDLLAENEAVVTAIKNKSMRAGKGRSSGRGPGRVRLAKSMADKALAEGVTNVGNYSFNIPDKAQQLKGFDVNDAGVLVAQYGQYKFVEDKGKPKTQNVKI